MNLINFIADATTQPTGGFRTWSVEEWLLLIAGIAGIVASWRRGGDAKVVAHAADAKASTAVGGMEALKTMSLAQAAQVDSVNDRMAAVALAVPPPAAKTEAPIP